jgi:hypothetical protein
MLHKSGLNWNKVDLPMTQVSWHDATSLNHDQENKTNMLDDVP